MSTGVSPFYIFNTHGDAQDAMRTLNRSGFDVTKLSLVTKNCHTQGRPVSFFSSGDRVRSWANEGEFWRGIGSQLLAPAIFIGRRGQGVTAMAGSVANGMVSAREAAAVACPVSAISAALSPVGFLEGTQLEGETTSTQDPCVLMVHGNANDLATVAAVLMMSNAKLSETH